MTDHARDADDQAFIKTVNEGLVPQLRDSAFVASLVPTPEDVDAKFAVELGLSLMFDKPIIAIATDGRVIPDSVRRIAAIVLDVDLGTDEGQAALKRAVEELSARLDEDGKLRTDVQNLIDEAKVKTQYGVRIIWKDPVAAGQRGDEPLIFWFDSPEQAQGFYLNNCKPINIIDGELIYDDPPELKNEIDRLERLTRQAIETYGEPEPA